MTILALEFSTDRRDVAVLHDGKVCGQASEEGGRASHPFSLVDTALKQAQLEREQIQRIVIGIGPGSYTGIRAAIAVAQGWQLGRNVEVGGLATTDVLVAQARRSGLRGKICPIIDAQRGEVYLAEYEVDESGFKQTSVLRIAAQTEIAKLATEGACFIGPDATRWISTGLVLLPSAAVMAELACQSFTPVPAEMLEPIYLREVSFVKAPPARVIPAV